MYDLRYTSVEPVCRYTGHVNDVRTGLVIEPLRTAVFLSYIADHGVPHAGIRCGAAEFTRFCRWSRPPGPLLGRPFRISSYFRGCIRHLLDWLYKPALQDI
jgi:hypothetical protein